ncbi:hypothetical protein ABBQ32_006246 [Trebouxia sp. C0010 RCD-2024]
MEERQVDAEQRTLLQKTLQSVLQATSAQQQQKLEDQKYQSRIVAMVQANSDLLASSVKGAMSGNPAVFCTALFCHQALQNEAMQERLEAQMAAAQASAQEKRRSDEALRLEQEERAAAVTAASSHLARADSLDQKLQTSWESKAQACAAAEAGQRESLEKARNTAIAHEQAVAQQQAALAAQQARIEGLERVVESKTQACAAAEAGRLHALDRESGSVAVRNKAFQKLKAAEEEIKKLTAERKAVTTPELSLSQDLQDRLSLSCPGSHVFKGRCGSCGPHRQVPGMILNRKTNVQLGAMQTLAAAQNQMALLEQELDDQKKATSHNLESIRRKHAAEVTRLRGSLSSGQAQAKRVAALQHELTAAQEEAAAAREANRQAVTALAEATNREAVAEDRRLK